MLELLDRKYVNEMRVLIKPQISSNFLKKIKRNLEPTDLSNCDCWKDRELDLPWDSMEHVKG